VTPIVKKGEGESVQEYRGVTITSALYKIYAMVLTGRIEEEVEEKKIIPKKLSRV